MAIVLGKIKSVLVIDLFFFGIFIFSSLICWGADDEETKIKGMTLISEKEVQQYPHGSILSIECEFDLGKKKLPSTTGTGFLIGANFALTAAHVVCFQGSPATKITCYIGRHGKEYKTFVDVKSYVFPIEYRDLLLEHIRIKKIIEDMEKTIKDIKQKIKKLKYKEMKKEKDQLKARLDEMKKIERNLDILCGDKDYALLYWTNSVDDFPLAVNEEAAFITARSLSIAAKSKSSLMFCGYPEEEKERSRFCPHEANAEITDIDKVVFSELRFSTLCYPGMSGSPIRYRRQRDNGDWEAIAILISEVREGDRFLYSKAYRLTADKLARINSWEKVMAGENVSSNDRRGLINGGLIFNTLSGSHNKS